MTGFGTVDEPGWVAIQRDLADRGEVPWWFGLTPEERSQRFAEMVMDAAKGGPNA